ncbi:CAP domain-containing protein [Trinickia acidisoli]|uniref:CAP domain-containing protein n=1 Tax=Trinickia acidisoli TaxID=2767482 RepID=UPI001A8C2D03|nr:CAP domain-containing protein [Trinickia acidisoli]
MRKTAMAATLAAGALAACGGGGSGNGSGGSASTGTGSGGSTTSSQAISLFAAPGAAAGTFTATGDVNNDSFGFLNNMRAQAGLAALSSQSGVAQAAANHSVWEQDNNVVGHYETAGQTGFTGVSPSDRVNLYYSTTSVGEATAGVSGAFSTSTEPVELLFNAPFHRAIMLFDSVNVGVGSAQTTNTSLLSTLTIDFADYKQVVPDNQLVAWPYNGQTGVDTTWIANESPNPMAAGPSYEGQSVGYPVTLTGSDNAAFSNVAFAITDSTGANVPCQEVDSSNNSEAVREAMCVPFQPLATNMTYTVKVTGTLTNTSLTATPFSLSWSFTTAAAATVHEQTTTPPATRRVIINGHAQPFAKRVRLTQTTQGAQ